MGDRQDRRFTMAGPDQYNPSFAMYENSFQRPFPRAPGPPVHFDGIPFWYRPDPQDPAFDHSNLLYHQGMPAANSPVEQPASIKHRRTRSGCFTCRQRRVKCDETRPVCERCKKGNRECQFPQPSSSSRRIDANELRTTQTKVSQETRDGSSRSLPSIEDESEEGRDGSVSPEPRPPLLETNNPKIKNSKAVDKRHKKQAKGHIGNDNDDSSPSAGTISPPTRTRTPASLLKNSADAPTPNQPLCWKQLSPTIQQYLRFHRDNITRCHYFLKLDSTDFIHNELMDAALSFEPLLFAVVGFAAYHLTLGSPNGRFQDFWKYYCRSIMLLRKWLESHTDRTEAVLLTVLQLATFEEYLGDWAGLASHQKAAYSIFGTLYTYENFMSTPTSRYIFDWLARGDVAVSLAAGANTTLDRKWFVIALRWYQSQVDPELADSSTAASCLTARLRLISFDIAAVHASAASNPNVMKDIRVITERADKFRTDIQTLHRVTTSSSKAGSETLDDARFPLFRGDHWLLNFLWVDYYAMEQMHKYKTALLVQAMQSKTQSRCHAGRTAQDSPQASTLRNPPAELEKLSLIQCQLFEAIEKYPNAPPGALLGCQTSLALSSLFLHKVPKYIGWARRKLAKIERLGYVWPPSFRKRMAQLWQDDELLDWWLPNEEHKIDLLDEIREVVEERNKESEDRGGDEWDDVRETRAVFDKLDFSKGTLRARKDSVWSVAGTEGGVSRNVSSPDESDGSDDDDSGDDDEEEVQVLHQHGRGSRDSGVGATASRQARAGPPTLEYSNRMSGIWEG